MTHLPGICISKTLLSSVLLTTFWTQTPFWPWWLLHNPTSVIDICQNLYAYHAIKGNLSDVCSPASQCSNLPVFQQLSASFAPVTDLCWFTELPQIHQRSTVYLQKPSKSECVFAHISRGKENDVTGSESKIYSTKPDFWSCYTTRGNTLRCLCRHTTGFTHKLLFLPDLNGILWDFSFLAEGEWAYCWLECILESHSLGLMWNLETILPKRTTASVNSTTAPKGYILCSSDKAL